MQNKFGGKVLRKCHLEICRILLNRKESFNRQLDLLVYIEIFKAKTACHAVLYPLVAVRGMSCTQKNLPYHTYIATVATIRTRSIPSYIY